jgi:hypothetical protein
VAVRDVGDNFSRYGYGNNNPYRFVDPDGRESGAAFKLLNQMETGTTSGTSLTQDQGEAIASFIPGADVAKCANAGCGAGGWAMAGLGVVPGAGKGAQIGIKITRASLNRVKALVRALSKAEAKAKPIDQAKVERLERIVEKAGGTLRNDGAAGVKGSSAGTPHVQTEGLGNRTDSRHIWTEPDVKLKDER